MEIRKKKRKRVEGWWWSQGRGGRFRRPPAVPGGRTGFFPHDVYSLRASPAFKVWWPFPWIQYKRQLRAKEEEHKKSANQIAHDRPDPHRKPTARYYTHQKVKRSKEAKIKTGKSEEHRRSIEETHNPKNLKKISTLLNISIGTDLTRIMCEILCMKWFYCDMNREGDSILGEPYNQEKVLKIEDQHNGTNKKNGKILAQQIHSYKRDEIKGNKIRSINYDPHYLNLIELLPSLLMNAMSWNLAHNSIVRIEERRLERKPWRVMTLIRKKKNLKTAV